MSRLSDIVRFYTLLDRLEQRVGGKRTLAHLSTHRDWPRRGVYFFFEPTEFRTESGTGPRVARIGTHALSAGARSTLRQRLAQHRGSKSGGGNHRGSIFRLLVGGALQARGDVERCASWGVKGDVAKASASLNIGRDSVVSIEAPIEQAVTSWLAHMPFVWLDIDDEPASDSLRGIIERNTIALLSNYERSVIDPPSPAWLGQFSDSPLVRGSGLWNQRHVGEIHDGSFLDKLENLIEKRG